MSTRPFEQTIKILLSNNALLGRLGIPDGIAKAVVFLHPLMASVLYEQNYLLIGVQHDYSQLITERYEMMIKI